jgi:hypothetical protein
VVVVVVAHATPSQVANHRAETGAHHLVSSARRHGANCGSLSR